MNVLAQIPEELARQVPNLLVLAWIVFTFLKRQKEMEASFSEHMKQRDRVIMDIHADYKAYERETNEVIRANTVSLIDVANVMKDCGLESKQR